MAGMYYSLQEVIEKLGKGESEIKEMVKDGKLHEFRDGAQVVFKVDEVDAIVAERADLGITGSEIELVLDETGEISLDTAGADDAASDDAPAAVGGISGGFGLSSMGDLTNADTNVGTTGINVLGGTDDEFTLTEDTKAETRMLDDELGDLGDLDADSNLESVGSGSGLLDLSLQADDTSLGAVLDDILPAAIDGEPEGLDLEDDMAEEADKIFEASQSASGIPPAPAPEPLPRAPVAAPRAYAAAAAESSSSAFSVAMFLPLVAVVYAGIVVAAGLRGVVPGILKAVESGEFYGMAIFWYILFALMLVVAVAGIFGFQGSSGQPKAKKVKKAKKAKAPKAKKKKKK
ncbi:MAG: helix-turn-helix domain-containing protein [Planctomycetes bacterium]|nr:helix-turn-helix domain-containing protein [Planctomycetota bacterium]